MDEFLFKKELVKYEILNAVCRNFSIRNDEIASIQHKKPFDMIAKLPKNADFRNWWSILDYVGTNIVNTPLLKNTISDYNTNYE